MTERRNVPSEFEVRDDAESEPSISGYAAVFNSDSRPPGFPFVERIAPGAFRKTISEADVKALLNHDPNFVLGRSTNGTLRLAEDQRGLRYEVDPDLENPMVLSAYRMIKRGDVSQSSFGFRVVKEDWDYDADPIERTVREVELFDVSPVTYPFYQATEVDARSTFSGLARQVQRPLDEVVDAAERGELRSYLHTSTTGSSEPVVVSEEPATTTPQERSDDHSHRPDDIDAVHEKLNRAERADVLNKKLGAA